MRDKLAQISLKVFYTLNRQHREREVLCVHRYRYGFGSYHILKTDCGNFLLTV